LIHDTNPVGTDDDIEEEKEEGGRGEEVEIKVPRQGVPTHFALVMRTTYNDGAV